MYTISVHYGKYAFYEGYQNEVVEVIKQTNLLTDGKVFQYKEDAENIITLILNSVTSKELGEDLVDSDLFIKKVDGEISLFDVDGDFILSLKIVEPEVVTNIDKEESKIYTIGCAMLEEYGHYTIECDMLEKSKGYPVRYIDIHAPFIVKIKDKTFDVTSVIFKNNKLYYVHLLDLDDYNRCIYVSMVFQPGESAEIKKEQILDSSLYVYEEILKGVTELML